ncbi:hypothetical protein Tcan_01662, partial [Toxocara canis]
MMSVRLANNGKLQSLRSVHLVMCLRFRDASSPRSVLIIVNTHTHTHIPRNAEPSSRRCFSFLTSRDLFVCPLMVRLPFGHSTDFALIYYLPKYDVIVIHEHIVVHHRSPKQQSKEASILS